MFLSIPINKSNIMNFIDDMKRPKSIAGLSVTFLVTALLLGSISNAYAQNSDINKPNFLIIVGDDFGYL